MWQRIRTEVAGIPELPGGVNTLWRAQASDPYRHSMKADHKQKTLTFGNLIETVYGVCGDRRARGIIRLAIDTHIVVFREQQRVFDLLNRWVTP
ncbi:MAG: hypothetical protein ABSA12_16665 [Verrucomicrobiia bacterium]|jgi:hypothetical protein